MRRSPVRFRPSAVLIVKCVLYIEMMLKKIFFIFIHPEFIYLTLFGNSLIFCSGGLFYWLEKDQNANITSFIDALWWAVVTMTTVGYGDIIPVTLPGRILALVT